MSEQDDDAKFGVELVDGVTLPGTTAGKQVDALAAKFKKLEKISNGAGASLAKSARSIAFKGIDSGVNKLGKGLAYAAAGAVATSTAFATFAGKYLVEGVTGMMMFAQNTRRGYGFLLHDQAKGNEAFTTAVSLANELGMNVQEVGSQLQHMLAMQFTVGEATELIKLSQDLQVIGASAEQAHRALNDMTQIKAAGRLQTQEINYLASAGVSAELIYNALGETLGKTTEEVKKLMSAGKISSKVGLAAISSAIKHKVGEHEAGEVAKKNLEGLQGSLQRLKNLPDQMLLKMAENIGPAQLDKIAVAVKSITDQIANLDTSGFEKFVVSALTLANVVGPLLTQLVQGFGTEFGAGMDEFKVALSPESIKRAHDLGVAIAKIVKGVLWTLDKISWVIEKLSTTTGGWGLAAAAFLATIWKIFAAYKAVRDVLKGIGLLKDVVELAAPVVQSAVKHAGRDGLIDFGAQAAPAAAGGWMAKSWGVLKSVVVKGWSAIVTVVVAAWGWISATFVTIVEVVAGVTLGLAAAILFAVGSMVYLGYTIYKNWGALLDSFDWFFSNLGTALQDFTRWAFKWIARVMTGGVSMLLEGPDDDRTQGQKDVDADTAAHARRRPRPGAPVLNPAITATAAAGNKTLTVGKMDVVVNAVDVGGDPAKAGKRVGAAASDGLHDLFLSLGEPTGAAM